MQPRNLPARVARPRPFITISFVIAMILGNVGFAYAQEPQQKIYYFLHDHLGGISAVTDEEGNVVERRDYLPFGSDRLIPDAQYLDYGFTGKEKDPESELYYYGARYYDPFTGRFISPDPLLNALDTMNQEELNAFLSDPRNLNIYSYAKNNPLLYIDPTGESAVTMGGFGRILDGTVKVLIGGSLIFKEGAYSKKGWWSFVRGANDMGKGLYQTWSDVKLPPSPVEEKVFTVVEKMVNRDFSNEQKQTLKDVVGFNFFSLTFEAFGKKVEKAGEAFGNKVRSWLKEKNSIQENKRQMPTIPSVDKSQKSTINNSKNSDSKREYRDSWNKSNY